jgi:GNAT superfamily N-acetyltransferase
LPRRDWTKNFKERRFETAVCRRSAIWKSPLLDTTWTFSAMSDFEIRSAVEADVAIILSLIRELAEYERAPDAVVATEAGLRDVLFGPKRSAEVLLALENGEAVGFAVYFYNFSTWLGRPGLYLEDLFVRPAVRGKGFGRTLLKRLAQIAKERGCGRMEWAVLDWNDPAIQFYRKLGAEPMNQWTVFRLTEEGIAKLASRSGSL